MKTDNRQISIMGCGWLGLEVGRHLVEQGFSVHGSTTSENKLSILETAGIEPFLLSVQDEISAPQILIQSFFSNPILLLNIPPGRRNPTVVTDHLQQVKTVIQAAKKYGIEKVIFISSTGVFGDENRIMTEEDQLNPVRNSGKALVGVEKFLKSQKGLKVNILRLAGLIGGDRKAGRFFAGKTDVKGGNARVNMVWRKDCVQVIDALIKKDIWGETFNVCADNHPFKKDYYVRKAKEEGFEPPVFSEDVSANFKIVSNEKVKRILGVKFAQV